MIESLKDVVAAPNWFAVHAAVAVALVLLTLGEFGFVSHVFVQQGRVSSLPVPRFVSLRTNPVNLRSGPGVRYPVAWVYQRRHLPVEITDEFDNWRRIRDPEGTEGWVHQSMLSGQRTGLVSSDISPVYKGSNTASALIARVSPGVVILVERCPEQTEFCFIEAGGIKGWLRRGLFWGLYDGEYID